MISIIASLALAAVTQPDPPPTGSRLGKHNFSGLRMSEKDSSAAAQRYAECLVAKRSSLARTYLLSVTSEEAEAAGAKLFARVQCLGITDISEMSDTRMVSASPDVMRGLIAQAALKKEGGRLASLPALSLAKVYDRAWYGSTGRDRAVDEMAVCVAETNPAGIVSLLRAGSFTSEEGASVSALSANFSSCLRAGAKLQANRQAMRAALADALFRRMNTPAPSSISEAKP